MHAYRRFYVDFPPTHTVKVAHVHASLLGRKRAGVHIAALALKLRRATATFCLEPFLEAHWWSCSFCRHDSTLICIVVDADILFAT